MEGLNKDAITKALIKTIENFGLQVLADSKRFQSAISDFLPGSLQKKTTNTFLWGLTKAVHTFQKEHLHVGIEMLYYW